MVYLDFTDKELKELYPKYIVELAKIYSDKDMPEVKKEDIKSPEEFVDKFMKPFSEEELDLADAYSQICVSILIRIQNLDTLGAIKRVGVDLRKAGADYTQSQTL